MKKQLLQLKSTRLDTLNDVSNHWMPVLKILLQVPCNMIVRNRKPMILAIACLLFLMNGAYSAIITVDNSQPRMGQFSSIQEAHDAANSGDTIMVYPSYALYDSIVCSKKIILIGAGFQPSQIGLKTTIIKEMVKFNPGSDGSVITGFGDDFSIVVDADNISIIKNRFDKLMILENHYGTAIIQNYIDCASSEAYIIDIKPNNELIMINNIIINIGNFYYAKGMKADSESNSSFIANNVFYLPNHASIALKVDNSNATIQNNIIIAYEIYVSSIGFFHNLCFNPERNSNEIDNTFIGRREFDFHLKAESPAIGAGINGVDLGAYGGDTPFDDNGYPAIPSIYYLDVPFTGTQKEGINVTIKVKSNN